MRIKLLFVALLCFATISCDSDSPNQQEENATKNETITTNSKVDFKSLNLNGIGQEKDGKVVLNVENEKIMAAFKNLSEKAELDLNPQSFELLKINNKNYLRFYSEGNKVSTIALTNSMSKNGGHDIIVVDGTVCTTTACASGGGCVPDGDYCTKCVPAGSPPNYPGGDCKRTTTG